MYVALISLQELVKASFQGFECVFFLSYLTYTHRTFLRKSFVMEFLWRDWWVVSELVKSLTQKTEIRVGQEREKRVFPTRQSVGLDG